MPQIFEPVVILKPEVVKMHDSARIDSFVKIEGGQGVTLGKHVHIASFCHINIGGGEVVIGDYAALASGAKVIGGSNQMEGESMSAAAPAKMQAVERAKTGIGPYAFVATNAVIMPGVVVGQGAVIGAGAVVNRDVPAYLVVAGVPARVIGWRPGRVPEMGEFLAAMGIGVRQLRRREDGLYFVEVLANRAHLLEKIKQFEISDRRTYGSLMSFVFRVVQHGT